MAGDYWAFFLGLPLAIAFLFSLVGNRLIQDMPWIDGLVYMSCHMLLAWTVACAATWTARYLCRSWRPRILTLCVLGFLLNLVPAALLFQQLTTLYSSWYPSFAALHENSVQPAWTLSYLAHFARYSLPALPLFIFGVWGYRALTGVDWLGYGPPAVSQEARPPSRAGGRATATVGLISESTLPADAEIVAIKAEQHYVQIWSTQGRELVRYRFRDAVAELESFGGEQVHRSWWVNLQRVRRVDAEGRGIELELENGLRVPVSLSHRKTVLRALERENPAIVMPAGSGCALGDGHAG